MRFLDLAPSRMREPAFPGQTVLGDGGEYLPTVLRAICEDSHRKETLVEWIRELTPMDVRGFEFPTDPSGRVHLVFLEANGRRVSAYAASDGTLRFLAMLAALLGPNPAGLYFFEEIDNGIHPSRVRLLIDLIERQTAKGEIQVVTTTHSPGPADGDERRDVQKHLCSLPSGRCGRRHHSPCCRTAKVRGTAEIPWIGTSLDRRLDGDRALLYRRG